jgi:signal transduction histidine kinase
VISLKNKTGLEVITAISYVFCLWGVGLIIIRLLAGGVHINATGLDLSFKIQFVLVLVVLVSLVFFGIGSGFFVERQYKVSAQRIIQEKLNSVELELKAKVFEYDVISERANGNFLEGIVIKLSKVFVTDINIYDPNGFLVASSRAKIFNSGLLSKQINPLALSDLKRNRKSYFSHIEQIGSLSYISSYIPFYNGKGVLLGYANLQRFGQQRDFELQIQEFIVAIVNVFILLLGISIIFSLIVSNWLTSPLRLLKQKVDSLKIASENQQIDYAGSDEIGLIVKAYNQKIGELQEASIQLAKNERESAWREMAKQVAHEIKNPLTPMKLSIQHLLRTYDPKDPDSKIRIETLLSSLIEQIDGLTRIANEFSNFAQMPGPIKVETDLIAIIKNAIALFESEVAIKIVLKTNLEAAILNIDKDQWGQALNNLIKNSLQALIEVDEAVIIISLEDKPEEDAYIIKVKDNGRGIKKEDLSKVFTPYFTTKSTGTGIGLFLVKQIVENHNGTISFETKENKGTTFSLVIPKTGN